MSFAQSLIVFFVSPLIGAYIFIIFVYIILGWLFVAGIIDQRNPTIRQIYGLLEKVSNFVLNPIRRIIPAIGGLDISPIFAILGLSWFRHWVLLQKVYPMLG